jgi:hypothetical protein
MSLWRFEYLTTTQMIVLTAWQLMYAISKYTKTLRYETCALGVRRTRSRNAYCLVLKPIRDE